MLFCIFQNLFLPGHPMLQVYVKGTAIPFHQDKIQGLRSKLLALLGGETERTLVVGNTHRGKAPYSFWTIAPGQLLHTSHLTNKDGFFHATLPATPHKHFDRTIYTDGGCREVMGQKQAGYGSYWGEEHPLNMSERLNDKQPTNQKAELMGILVTLWQLDDEARTEIITDSGYAAQNLPENLEIWANCGWTNIHKKPIENVFYWKKIWEEWKHKRQFVKVTWRVGHGDLVGNIRADQKATEGLYKPNRELQYNTVTQIGINIDSKATPEFQYTWVFRDTEKMSSDIINPMNMSDLGVQDSLCLYNNLINTRLHTIIEEHQEWLDMLVAWNRLQKPEERGRERGGEKEEGGGRGGGG